MEFQGDLPEKERESSYDGQGYMICRENCKGAHDLGDGNSFRLKISGIFQYFEKYSVCQGMSSQRNKIISCFQKRVKDLLKIRCRFSMKIKIEDMCSLHVSKSMHEHPTKDSSKTLFPAFSFFLEGEGVFKGPGPSKI